MNNTLTNYIECRNRNCLHNFKTMKKLKGKNKLFEIEECKHVNNNNYNNCYQKSNYNKTKKKYVNCMDNKCKKEKYDLYKYNKKLEKELEKFKKCKNKNCKTENKELFNKLKTGQITRNEWLKEKANIRSKTAKCAKMKCSKNLRKFKTKKAKHENILNDLEFSVLNRLSAINDLTTY